METGSRSCQTAYSPGCRPWWSCPCATTACRPCTRARCAGRRRCGRCGWTATGSRWRPRGRGGRRGRCTRGSAARGRGWRCRRGWRGCTRRATASPACRPTCASRC
ncbi:hypothetical protein JYU34_003977 [Plutella xylostella]|uniref:Uncharacterized protein n=1 Tax=Plutella xylostella TaxID=51655 RepID=A0ABQ7QWV2_PLUXY|nr:hypothetical protein JYU34_003977 [Plutella xylostella]